MAYHHMDLEKGPVITETPVSSPTSPNGSPMSAVNTYQLLVGDIDAPDSGNCSTLYHRILSEERSANRAYIITAILMYASIAAQVILCLGIVIGSQQNIGNTKISVLAAVNTAVAACIGVLKALGLPDKKAAQRRQLQKVAERIRDTTRKLRAGFEIDVTREADTARDVYEQIEDEAQMEAAKISVGAPGGSKAHHGKA